MERDRSEASAKVAEEDVPIFESTGREVRHRIMTEKGQLYATQRKAGHLSRSFKRLKQKFTNMCDMRSDKCDISLLRNEHSLWLTLYEEFLLQYHDYCGILGADQEDQFSDREEYLRQCKTRAERWFLHVQKPISKVGSEIDPGDSASQLGQSIGSYSSSKLQEEQHRGEISAKMIALKKRHELELAKLSIKLEEEQLELTTELEIAEAKSKILEHFKNSSVTYQSRHHVKQGFVSDKVSVKRDIVSVVNNVEEAITKNVNVAKKYHGKVSSHVNIREHPQLTHYLPGILPAVPSQLNDSEQAVANVVRHLRKPIPEIKKFSGDPLEYRKFVRQFKTKTVNNSNDVDECLNYLEQFTEGEAHKIVNSFSYLEAVVGYPAALQELHQRYGDEEVLANAFVKRALGWSPVKADNPKAMDAFAIFLGECENAVQNNESVKVLPYPDNMKKLVGKLPFHLHDKWRNIVQQVKHKSETVQFTHLAQFVKSEAKKANDPTYGREALAMETGSTQPSKYPMRKQAKSSFATNLADTDVRGESHATDSTNVKVEDFHSRACKYCNELSHTLEACRKLSKLPYSDRIDFIKSKGLCYGCLKEGHQSRSCRSRHACRVCQYKHPTVLNDSSRGHVKVKNAADVQRKEIPGDSKHASMRVPREISMHTGAGVEECMMTVIPVRVQMNNGLQSVVTYAFLDPGSSISFCTERLLERIGGSGRKMNITLDTMGSAHRMQTTAVDGLQVRDLNLKNIIDMPRVYTKEDMPISKKHIPMSKDIAKWSHRNDVNLPTINTGIDLLIGNNVPDAYTPLEVRTGPRNSPHATRSRLGWIVWNVVRDHNKTDKNKQMFCVNRIEVVALKEEEKFRRLDQLVINSMNMDFPERLIEDKKEHSEQDKMFLQQVNDSIQLERGHYIIGLPFKEEGIIMPNNEVQVLRRLEHLKKRLQRDSKFCNDYKNFMEQILKKGYAERVAKREIPGIEGRVWYIPHHGVYHPKKPNKLRVVFYCAATYLGTSLNSILLQGPDMTNNLLGVLLRFRQDMIGIMGDIEAMYYQVHVPALNTITHGYGPVPLDMPYQLPLGVLQSFTRG